MKQAAVIGGGFGGIAAALRLRSRGADVTLYERLDALGGRAQVFKKNVIFMMQAPLLSRRLIYFMSYLNCSEKNSMTI